MSVNLIQLKQSFLNRDGAAYSAKSFDEVLALNLGAMIKQYAEHRAQSTRREQSNIKVEASSLNCLQRDLGHLSIGEVTLGHVTQMSNHAKGEVLGQAQPLSDNTICKYQKLLRAVVKHVNSSLLNPEMRGCLAHHPVITQPLHRGGKQARDTRVSVAELDLVCSYLRKPMNVFAVKLLVQTGLRLGELFSVTWNDVSIERRQMKVIDPAPEKKSKVTERVAPLSDEAIETLKQMHREGLISTMPILDTTARSLQQAFAKACEKAGIQDLTVHDLRRECASRAIEGGAQLHEVAKLTGHRDLATLKRHYAHPAAEVIAERIAAKSATNDQLFSNLFEQFGDAA